MHQHQRDRAFGQQPDFARDLARRADIRAREQFGEMRFEHRLVPSRDDARRMSRQIGELDDQPGEAGAGPARPVGPRGEVPEQRVDDGLGRAGQAVAEGAERRQRQAMLRLQHGGEQLVLALEMIVERALGHRGRGRDLVHADAGVAPAAEQAVGRIEDARAASLPMSAALASSSYVYRVVNLHRRASSHEMSAATCSVFGRRRWRSNV